jgi:hypothetical protein
MKDDKFNLFPETWRGLIHDETDSILRSLQRALEESRGSLVDFWDELPAGELNELLFMSVVRKMADRYNGDAPPSAPSTMEAAVAELVRSGVPRKDVSASYQSLTVKLTNAVYRMYREAGGYPGGTVKISHNDSSVVIRSGYSGGELARFILLLDSHLPEIDEAAASLLQDLRRELIRKQAEEKALELARAAVEAQLSAVLPGMGISCTYKISDGKVRLRLTRLSVAEMELPMEALPDFLSVPERVESSLVPETVSKIKAEKEKTPLFPGRFIQTGKTLTY